MYEYKAQLNPFERRPEKANHQSPQSIGLSNKILKHSESIRLWILLEMTDKQYIFVDDKSFIAVKDPDALLDNFPELLPTLVLTRKCFWEFPLLSTPHWYCR